MWFGDQANALDKSDLVLLQSSGAHLYEVMQAAHCIFLNQVHGTDIHIVDQPVIHQDALRTSLHSPSTVCAQSISYFEFTGDILITTEPSIALGILTADCLPIILYDPKTQVIAAVHAGWRGTYNEVVKVAAQKLHDHFGVVYSDLLVQLGPAARSCCYRVQKELVDQFQEKFPLFPGIDNGETRFTLDIPAINAHQLELLGVLPENIDWSSCICTICHEQFCSYRRGGAGYSLRNVTLAMLR